LTKKSFWKGEQAMNWLKTPPIYMLLLVGLLGVSLALAPVALAEEAAADTEAIAAAGAGDSADSSDTTSAAAEEAPAAASLADVDTLWVCLAAFLVFFMQAGFALVECGFTRAKNSCNIIMKNVMDFAIGSITFWLVGFGLMFGATSALGFWGVTNFFYDAGTNNFNWAFLLFQTVFCATAATIVSGAMAERTKFVGYLCYTVAITVIVYPIFGSWAWGGLLDGGGWLEGGEGSFLVKIFGEGAAFHDFAGSTVVHSIGGWCALAGAIVLGARIGKYGKDGKVNAIPGHNIPMAALGVFILWLGWFGFNPGSTTAVGGGNFAFIAVTTNLAAAAGAVSAMIVSWIMFKKPDPSFTLNGALAGLVAITAGCDAMHPGFAVVTGLVAGAIVVLSVLFFDKIRIDDPVGAVSVHGVCGLWGTLAIGLFQTGSGLLVGGGVQQILVQLVGVLAAFMWAFPVSLGIFYAVKATVGLRVSAEEEAEGLDIREHGMHAYPAHLVVETYSGAPVMMPAGSPAGFAPAFATKHTAEGASA
jgi:Amt family ammonium transporter